MILIKINIMANKVLGMHRFKNKVNRNAFDLSHRHMFTAQIGELLPVFSQWVNPNETFKIGYNGKTRTAALNTDAFTRIRENIQYYFVPFQSLWKYFEQQVNNMTKGDAGQNISKFASSSTEASSISTSMPYVSYVDLAGWLNAIYRHAVDAIDSYFQSLSDVSTASPSGFYDFCFGTTNYRDVFVCEGYRYVRASKLLMALGYGNFSVSIRYDVFAMASEFVKAGAWSKTGFLSSDFALDFTKYESASIRNSPNLSIFPLLAYHKICNDHYRNDKWQPFQPWTCNIDYIGPSDNMDISSHFKLSSFLGAASTLLDLENSNLPIDYFTSVLPRAQYGDEGTAVINLGNASGSATISGESSLPTSPLPESQRFSYLYDSTGRAVSNKSLSEVRSQESGIIVDSADAERSLQISTAHKHTISGAVSVNTNFSGSLKISALRSATALQKYKEIQNSNDPDFAAQVLAHFGIKPKVDSRVSVFIGGDDKVLSINPQVNTNFQDGGEPEIKAIGIGDLSAGCKFTSTTYGMIIGIYRAIPQLDFSRIGIDRNLFKTDSTDFPIPEMDSIGMQTQYRCELSAPSIGICKNLGVSQSYKGALDMATTYGYAPRYAELKAAYDFFEGGFCGAYSSWVTGYDSRFLANWRNSVDVQSSGAPYGIDDLFKCRPSLLYPIFMNQWSGTVNDDKLLIGSVNTCVAVRPFSIYGLPYSK